MDGHEHRVWKLSVLDSISVQQLLSCQCPHQWSQPSHTVGLYPQRLCGRLPAACLVSTLRAANQTTIKGSFPYRHFPCIEAGNTLASRAILIAMLCWALCGCFCLEQPRSTRLVHYPRWERFLLTRELRLWWAAWWARHYAALSPYLGRK